MRSAPGLTRIRRPRPARLAALGLGIPGCVGTWPGTSHSLAGRSSRPRHCEQPKRNRQRMLTRLFMISWTSFVKRHNRLLKNSYQGSRVVTGCWISLVTTSSTGARRGPHAVVGRRRFVQDALHAPPQVEAHHVPSGPRPSRLAKATASERRDGPHESIARGFRVNWVRFDSGRTFASRMLHSCRDQASCDPLPAQRSMHEEANERPHAARVIARLDRPSEVPVSGARCN